VKKRLKRRTASILASKSSSRTGYLLKAFAIINHLLALVNQSEVLGSGASRQLLAMPRSAKPGAVIQYAQWVPGDERNARRAGGAGSG
jgi:hypothetical protein